MDHENNQVTERLSRIETKLDKHLEQTHKNQTDLNWVKGYIKINTSAMLAIVTSLVINFFKLYK